MNGVRVQYHNLFCLTMKERGKAEGCVFFDPSFCTEFVDLESVKLLCKSGLHPTDSTIDCFTEEQLSYSLEKIVSCISFLKNIKFWIQSSKRAYDFHLYPDNKTDKQQNILFIPMTASKLLTSIQGYLLLLSIMLLFVQLSAPNWQASGNMTDYIPTIRGFMDAAIADSLDRTTIATNISDSCNAVWDQFWYVMVVWLRDASSDMILYGYAFRNHWYWHNNYSPAQQSFIIWKDYNCERKMEQAQSLTEQNAGNTQVANAILNAYTDGISLEYDIWQWTHDTIENYLFSNLQDEFGQFWQKIGFSAVAINEIPTQYGIRLCRIGSIHYIRRGVTPAKYFFYGFPNRVEAGM